MAQSLNSLGRVIYWKLHKGDVMIPLADRIQQDNVRIRVKYIDYRVTDNWPHHLYRVTLLRKGRQWTLDFKMGSGLTEEPDALTVLANVLSDSWGYQNSSGFADWADEYGYEIQDPEIRAKAAKIYKAVKAQSNRAEKFLQGDFIRYVEQTDWSI